MKSALIKALLYGCLYLVAAIPSSCVEPFARFLGWFYALFPSRDRSLIASNVQRVYGLAPHSNYAKTFQKQVFQSQVACFIETIQANLSRQEKVSVEGLPELGQVLKECKREDQGLIIVTAHCGSWEFVARSMVKASGRRFFALAKPSHVPEFTALLDDLRERMQTDVLWTDSKNLLRDMIKVLKAGDCLGFVMDQKPEGRVGPVVDFLGQPTEFVSGPAKLAARHQCPVLAVFCMRTGPWRYRLIYRLIVGADHGLSDEIALTQMMATAIEECIKVYPEQWVWNYKRWRSPMSKALPVTVEPVPVS